MNTSFVYDSPVTGSRFIGRRHDVDILRNLLSGGNSTVVYGEPGCGCMSLVQQTLAQMKMQTPEMIVAEIDFSRCRTTEDLLVSFSDGLLKACGSSPSEYRAFVQSGLAGAHFVFDQDQFDAHGLTVSMNWMPDDVDIMKTFDFPAFLAEQKQAKLVILVRQFQNVLFSPDNDVILDAMEKVIERQGNDYVFIFTGSRFNRLREIFDVRRCFWHIVERIIPSDVNPDLIADFVYHNFQLTGKVLEKDLVVSTAGMLRCNMRYVNHLFSIVDSMAKGYVNKGTISDAMRIMLSVYTPHFFNAVCSLTDFQLSLLKAIVHGETRFSAAGVIERYCLNSSANVKRVKDALVKKELVWFDEQDVPHIQDPLFEYWLRQEYFAL